ncbi:unnamed protein product [Candida verbasci]|uniref:Tubulin gamma chain n=1 Tax=Candida verbasci TaxID=1227364 RepID=A0A9W4TWW5_9ASCO|nr:unnamed protein product [Candida verbasci]
MPGETITLQVGQCGNQVGLQYWQQLASEHGINNDGSCKPWPQIEDELQFQYNNQRTYQHSKTYREDHPELFFTLSESSNKYTPRSILIDLEPSVVNKCLNNLSMINPRNVHLSEQGNGAANNWLNGYQYGNENSENLLNLIDRELDKCDNLSNFQLLHSVAGGTGSGVGSRVLELLDDRFSKKLVNSFSIFPATEPSDVVVQPYNSVLTLKKLIDFTDAVFMFQNDELNRIENNDHFQNSNKIISNIASTMSNTLRFPSYNYSSIEEIFSSVIPTADLKFLAPSFAPETSLFNINQEISYISMMNFIVGRDIKVKEVKNQILKIANKVKFVPWTTKSIGIAYGRQSPYISKSQDVLQVSNNSSTIKVLNKILHQYRSLITRKAYLTSYYNSIGEQTELFDMFKECEEAVIKVVEEYKLAQGSDYLD